MVASAGKAYRTLASIAKNFESLIHAATLSTCCQYPMKQEDPLK
jgi:hypothetical protein